MVVEDFVIGRHVYGNMYGVDPSTLWDEDFIKETVLKAVEAAGATLHDLKSWKIEGEKGGVSVIALVLESHISIHTWPGYKYATVDVYTCGDTADPWRGFEVILNRLNPKFYTVHYSDRSSLPPDVIEELGSSSVGKE
ncbi:MAG: adenosylmethionine decarboxylase [Desulfurococcales archaeon]|nr:adenosylmethionine decarboxylase [Desulfurococcales archaeon]